MAFGHKEERLTVFVQREFVTLKYRNEARNHLDSNSHIKTITTSAVYNLKRPKGSEIKMISERFKRYICNGVFTGRLQLVQNHLNEPTGSGAHYAGPSDR